MLIPYEKEHRKWLVDVFYDVYTREPFSYDWLKKESLERYFYDIENTPNFLGFILMQEDKAIGACIGIVNNYFQHTTFYVKEILIDYRYQGLGHGTFFF